MYVWTAFVLKSAPTWRHEHLNLAIKEKDVWKSLFDSANEIPGIPGNFDFASVATNKIALSHITPLRDSHCHTLTCVHSMTYIIVWCNRFFNDLGYSNNEVSGSFIFHIRIDYFPIRLATSLAARSASHSPTIDDQFLVRHHSIGS